MASFDLDRFIDGCRAAASREAEPWLAVRELLEEALRDRRAVEAALPVTEAELAPLYLGPEVAVIKVVWAPRMTFPPHDHLTWACNGMYAGCEHNTLFRLADGELHHTGELLIEEGGIGILADDAIHAVQNPDATKLAAAIHVYGGDFPSLPRSNWIGEPPQRVAASLEQTKQIFAAANDRPMT